MKTTERFALTTLGTAIMVGLTGCAATRDAEKDIKQTLINSKEIYNGADVRTSAAVLDTTREKNANFAKVQKNWVNPNPLPKDFINKKAETLPAFFQKKVSYTMPGSVSLVEIISEIKRNQKINVFIAQDIYNKNLALGKVIGGNDNDAEEKDPVALRISDFVVNNITLQEALDFLAAKANISWKWTGEEIEFFRYETKTYTINLLPGVTSMNSSVNLSSESESGSNSNGSGSSTTEGATATNNSGSEQAGKTSSSSTQGVSRSSTMDSWSDITKYLRPLMSPNGRLAIMESTGVITVTDTPDVQRKVSQAVKSLNNILSKQIMLKVDIYSVTMTGADDYGLDLNLAFTGSDRWGIIGFNSTSGSSASNTGTFTFTGSKRWQASAVLKALSSVGQASIVNQFNVATLNGQPTPIGNNRKIPYISGIEVSLDANGNPMQSIETSAVYQGISMNITPKVLPNGKILIEYAMNMSDFLGFETLSTSSDGSGQSLSLPNTALNNILQRAAVKSGQSMVLSGFKQRMNSSSRQGTPVPNTPLLGGGVNAETKEQYLVVVVTPTIAQDNEE